MELPDPPPPAPTPIPSGTARSVPCATARELASARLDGATSSDEDLALDRHLAGCTECGAWTAAIGSANARLRIGLVEPLPAAGAVTHDPVVAILEAIDRERTAHRPSMVPMARLALLLVAVAELVGAIPGLLGSGPLGSMSLAAHVSREHAAFEIALAVGFAWAAHRPLAAQGIGVVSAVLSVLVVATSSLDVAEGAVSLSLERGHLVAIVGTFLVWLVTHAGPGGRPSADQHRPVAPPRGPQRHAHA